jgi:hypothetical protein
MFQIMFEQYVITRGARIIGFTVLQILTGTRMASELWPSLLGGGCSNSSNMICAIISAALRSNSDKENFDNGKALLFD